MNKWPVIGALMILVGVVVLALMAGFILEVIVTLLKVLAVAIGVTLVLGGIAAILFGNRWERRRRMEWGQEPAAT